MIGENEFLSKHIDAYILATELRSGQLSNAYKAVQQDNIARTVVVHLFHAVRLPLSKHEQFLREVRTLKKVKHAHVLSILESGFYEDMPYIVTEYAAHGSLRDRINQSSPLPTQEAITILTGIGQALQFNHQVNIIHGNLKPENILFDKQGKARLADCRVMTIVDSIPIEMAHNANTFPYMAPEQFYGKTSKESDQYALGCIAYELLTGIVPFAQANFRTMGYRHKHEVLVPPTQLNMLLPNYLQEAILTALAKQESDRYPHIKDFITALTAPARPPVISIISPALAIPGVADATDIPFPSAGIAIQQPASIEAVTPGVPERPPDTPAFNLQTEPPAPVEDIPASSLPTIPDSLETNAPPVTPQPATDGENIVDRANIQETQLEQSNQHLYQSAPSNEHEVGQHEPPSVNDDIPTIPVPAIPVGNGQPVHTISPISHESNQPIVARNLLASAPIQTTIAAIRSAFAGTDQERRKLVKKFALLVGVSWLIIAILILSMFFIVLPSAHVLPGKSTAIVPTATHPILHPSPTTRPTAIPTPRPAPSPTPEPTPSPTPVPSPSPTPSPTPSPSPTPVAGLAVSPTSINPTTDCQNIQLGYRCTVTLSLPQEHQGNVRWTTSSSNLSAIFNPPRGTLSPGEQQQVAVFVRNLCPHSGDLIFQTDSTRLVIPVNC